MPSLLYLDTARLGRMSPGAQLAINDFHRFAGDFGGCMYFDEFLQDGIPSLPSRLSPRLPHLRSWQGLTHFKQRLKRFVGADPESRLLLANRTSQLMLMAARLLGKRCKNVLVTDLTWPPYLQILKRIAAASKFNLTCLPLRQRILRDKITAQEVSRTVCEAYDAHGCDGLFIPAVDNLGIRFPVTECVNLLASSGHVRCVVVDGAQAIGHIPLSLTNIPCDFFIGGCHKWLAAYQPMGLGFFGRRSSEDPMEETISRLLDSAVIDDPLLALTEKCGNGTLPPFGETVNLSPLFSCHGALKDAECQATQSETVRIQSDNADHVIELTNRTAWKPLRPDKSLQSGIILLQHKNHPGLLPEQIRHLFLKTGVALTAYSNGIIRLSMPAKALTSNETAQLANALRRIGSHR